MIMFLPDREALINFSPLGPFFLYRAKCLSKTWMFVLYSSQIISILLFFLYEKFHQIDLIGLTLLCSGFVGLSATPKIERLIQLRSGRSVSNRTAELSFSSLAFCCALLFLVKVMYGEEKYDNRILFFSMAITVLFLIYQIKIIFKDKNNSKFHL